jgi:hypothetical protein
MDRTTGGLKGFVRGFVSLLKPSSKTSDNITILVANKEVINMPTDGYLATVNYLICDTQVVGIENEADGAKVSNQFAIK